MVGKTISIENYSGQFVNYRRLNQLSEQLILILKQTNESKMEGTIVPWHFASCQAHDISFFKDPMDSHEGQELKLV